MAYHRGRRRRLPPLPAVARTVIADRAGRGRPLAMRVENDPHGVCVTALDDRGQPLAAVLLDYYGDRLTAIAQGGTADVPPQVHVLTRAVSAERGGAGRRRPRAAPAPSGAAPSDQAAAAWV